MKKNLSSDSEISFEVVNPNAAGMDIGSRFHEVSIAPGESQRFGVYTEDLHELGRYLVAHGIKTVAMEATGYYWKNPFVMLQDYGLEVILVNAKHTRNVRGRKSDKIDANWIRRLHSCGLLSASFQPDAFTERLRHYTRHRQNLIRVADSYINRMHKSLTLMNLHLGLVLSDIMGKSGRAIIEKILEGERSAEVLADLADRRVKASREERIKALTGYWREECLFELNQCYELFQFHRSKLAECDKKIEALLQDQLTHSEPPEQPTQNHPPTSIPKAKNDPDFDLNHYLFQLNGGIDLAAIPGVGTATLLTLVSEVGMDLKKSFPTASAFCSWLGLIPNNKISGGKLLSSKMEKKRNRLKDALRMAANAVGRTRKPSPLKAFFHRIMAKKGRKVAIIATARKIAALIYHMLDRKVQYKPEPDEVYRERLKNQRVKIINKWLKQLDINQQELSFI